MALQKKRVKQVINHVNYLKSQKDTKSPDELPTTSAGSSKVNTWLDDFDDPSTWSYGKRGVWDDKDTELLEKRFPQDTDDQLFTIFNREGRNRTYTKIKNTFKKRSKKASGIN